MNGLSLHLDGSFLKNNLNLDAVADDWLKVGTMMVVSRVLSGGALNNRAWQQESLFTLAGFTAYQTVVRNMVDTSAAGKYQTAVDDTLKVGTMLVVSRVLAGGSLTNRQWLIGSLATIVGFAVYNLVLVNYLPKGADLVNDRHIAMAIDDVAKVGTMLTVSKAVTGLAAPAVLGNTVPPAAQVFNRAWVNDSANTLAGFTAYNLVTSRLF